MKYPQTLEKIIRSLSRLPGVGKRTAERYAFDLLMRWKEHDIHDLASSLTCLKQEIGSCSVCGCITDAGQCAICGDPRRRRDILCVVSTPREVFTIENTNEFQGLYHVLGGLLSPLQGLDEEAIGAKKLKERVIREGIGEVIIALDSTLEGDTTALYIKEELAEVGVKVFRPAFGIPVGSSLEYVDGGSLARAFSGRSLF